MKLDVQISGQTVAQLYRERDEYVLKYLPGSDAADFISLTMPVRDEPWRWPRDLGARDAGARHQRRLPQRDGEPGCGTGRGQSVCQAHRL